MLASLHAVLSWLFLSDKTGFYSSFSSQLERRKGVWDRQWSVRTLKEVFHSPWKHWSLFSSFPSPLSHIWSFPEREIIDLHYIPLPEVFWPWDGPGPHVSQSRPTSGFKNLKSYGDIKEVGRLTRNNRHGGPLLPAIIAPPHQLSLLSCFLSVCSLRSHRQRLG